MKISYPIVRVKLLVLLAAMLNGPYLFAQVIEDWVAHYNGNFNGADYARDFEIDHEGNIYVIGTSTSMNDGMDIVTVSFDSNGQERWVARFNGADGLDDWGYSIAIDSAGYIYVCGSSQFLDTGNDIVIIKYDGQGGQDWVRYYNGPGDGNDEAVQVEVDCAGNVVATGTSFSSLGNSDYVTLKYTAGGDLIWNARYEGPAGDVDEARALAVDCDGNAYVSGGSTGDSTDFDFATIKYDTAGTELWVARYDGPTHGYDVVYYAGSVLLDSLGDVFITGYSEGQDSTYDYLTIKYDPGGNIIWADRYSGSQGNDYADALYLDRVGNLYVSGAGYDSVSGYDFLTVKYDSNGVRQWTARYNGPGNGWDEAYGIGTDSDGNVYVAGRSVGGNAIADFATIKYSPSGGEIWSVRYDGSAHNFDWPFRLLVDSSSNVLVGGWSIEDGHGSDYTIVKYVQTQNGLEGQDSSPRGSVLLEYNYPNPFNSRTEIRYYLCRSGPVRLDIYDILGRYISTLVNDEQEYGYHHVVWNSKNQSSGVYFYILETGYAIASRSMIHLK